MGQRTTPPAQAPGQPVRSLLARLLSAAVALPLLLLAVWAGVPWVAAVAALAALLGFRELAALAASAGRSLLAIPGALWAAAVAASAAAGEGPVVLIALGSGAAASLLIALVRRGFRSGLSQWLATAAGVAYLGLPLAAVVLLREGDHGLDWVLVALLGTFAADTGAYAVGRPLGRRPMAPSISPTKTWEGAVGGLLAASGATVGLVALLDMPFEVWAALGLGAGIGLAAQMGDLAQSKLKRLAGAKESGTFLPGHGGLLDRMDSLVPVLPLVYYVAMVWPES